MQHEHSHLIFHNEFWYSQRLVYWLEFLARILDGVFCFGLIELLCRRFGSGQCQGRQMGQVSFTIENQTTILHIDSHAVTVLVLVPLFLFRWWPLR
jgi:hypothetical protein